MIRLKKIIDQLIDETAFVHNRQNIDGILLTNEIIDDLKRRRKEGIIIKLDFEKAYKK